MQHDAPSRPRSRPLLLAARVLAVAFAVTVGGFLILREQRRANPAPAPPAEDRVEASSTTQGEEPAATVDGAPVEEVADAVDFARPSPYLSSSKSVSIGRTGSALVPPRVPASEEPAPTFFGSSKSLPPVDVVAPDSGARESSYLSSSKSGEGIDLFPAEDAADESGDAGASAPAPPEKRP